MSNDHSGSSKKVNYCPDCRNGFYQPFVCITCGAQKLYDETVRSQAAQIESLQSELAKERAAYARSFKAEVEVEALKHDLERVMARENHYLNESERLRAAVEWIADEEHGADAQEIARAALTQRDSR